ncbi:DUF2948 family protein [Marinimicrococcus flavescens]|uniref:DUF2948 family protein n=1 Tax=Marinimicrococcus flavescens TaxID=3031815 RepID=A0AAP4D4X6_9PROT|nr:DUF2948 family protein [Marinimicrococcus flavescens]
MEDKLRLRAADAEDLAVLAACLQDARVCLKEMVFQPAEHRFMAAFTRYRRERQPDPTSCEGLTECPSALVFEDIAEVKYRGLDPAAEDRGLSLLTIATEPGREHLIHVLLVFEGGIEIQLRTDRIHCRLDDFGEAAVCSSTPCDHFAQLSYEDMAGDGQKA